MIVDVVAVVVVVVAIVLVVVTLSIGLVTSSLVPFRGNEHSMVSAVGRSGRKAAQRQCHSLLGRRHFPPLLPVGTQLATRHRGSTA